MNIERFWYKSPAKKWIEALPLGNGRLGAMVYGRAREEIIQVDESSFWSGCASSDNNRADSRELLSEIREALLQENYEEADRLGHDFVGNKNQYGTNMPVGNLLLNLSGAEKGPEQYERSLDLAEGIARTRFTVDGISFVRETFVSNPAQVLALRMRGSEPFSLQLRYEGIEADVRISGGLREVRRTVHGGLQSAWEERKGREEDGQSCEALQIGKEGGRQLQGFRIWGDAREGLHSDGSCGVHLEGCLLLEHDGDCRYEAGSVYLTGCRELVCYLDLETDMFLQDPGRTALERVYSAAGKGYEALKAEHIADVKPLYERVSLSLGEEEKNMAPTDERIARMAAGEMDNDLCRLMFQYGRYLLIASSRENSPLPTHMGGIWNDNIYNNIDCTQDMHVDMNLQMQYWAAAQCSLPECYAPYFHYLENIVVPSGTRTAKEVYGADGWTAHVVTNPWGFTSLGWGYNWGVFSLGGAWLACLAWDYYEYTQDAAWLAEHGYPLIEGAAAFAADYVFWDEKSGLYMTGPSYSPENMFRANGRDYFLSLSGTCDVLLVREILTIYRKASAVLKKEETLLKRAEQILQKLPPYRIGKYGQLQEWYYDFEEPIPNHRHTSHLLGLYPFRQIVLERDEKLAEAAEVSIRRRHEDFEITSWGMNMLVGYYARLGEGEKACEMICETVRRIVKPNMASVMSDESSMWCGTWELDGNTGMTAAMAELFVQSFEGELLLLPALPRAWKDGELNGIAIKGGHRINLAWKDGVPVRLEIMAGRDEDMTVRFGRSEQRAGCRAGRKTVLNNFAL